jgi:hypothetical protein
MYKLCLAGTECDLSARRAGGSCRHHPYRNVTPLLLLLCLLLSAAVPLRVGEFSMRVQEVKLGLFAGNSMFQPKPEVRLAAAAAAACVEHCATAPAQHEDSNCNAACSWGSIGRMQEAAAGLRCLVVLCAWPTTKFPRARCRCVGISAVSSTVMLHACSERSFGGVSCCDGDGQLPRPAA